MTQSSAELLDPASEVEWEVWYCDSFDRECPPKCEVKGRGLVAGLKELWARHLFETVTTSGMEGFSHFHLESGPKRIEITGSLEGARRLRQYLFGTKEYSYIGYVRAANAELLEKVAWVHAVLIQRNQTSRPILDAAMESDDRSTFERRLDTFVE